MAQEISVLFVCLGNICRSPLAEGVFRHLLDEEGLTDNFRVDSAGTGGWHVGESPDHRAMRSAATRGVTLGGHARQVQPEDFRRFDYMIAMDQSNLSHLQRYRESVGGESALYLLREFDPDGGPGAEVPDPYYGGPNGFEEVYEMVERSCRDLLDHILNENGMVG
jgi:protein-tyrosine phosphatase